MKRVLISHFHGQIFCQGVAAGYAIMKGMRFKYCIGAMCRNLQVSKSGYYKWLHRKPSKRVREEGGWKVKNEAMLHTLRQVGRSVVGRAGFFEILGTRFHYLWGGEAFKETGRRFLIKNIG